jgi:molybdenum cofactor cytidylyltransferase
VRADGARATRCSRPLAADPDRDLHRVIAGLILAAGAGTRFGAQPKLLAELDGRPLLDYAVRAQCAVPELLRVVVVLGAHAEQVLERVDLRRAEPVICEDWQSGQAASLRRGVAALDGADKVLVTLGDEPLLTPAVIARFVGEPGGARAVYGGRPGHPVVLGVEQMQALAELTGDHGARELLQGGPRIECSSLCSGRDVDTPDDLEAISHEARTVL